MLEVIISQEVYRKDDIKCILRKDTKFINDMHHNTIAQIWHYHILNQLLSEDERKATFKELIDYYDRKLHVIEINPLVLMEFIKKESMNNKMILEYIEDSYKEKDEEFETTVSHSKWWIVLISLRYRGKLRCKELDKLFRNKQSKMEYKKLGIFELLYEF